MTDEERVVTTRAELSGLLAEMTGTEPEFGDDTFSICLSRGGRHVRIERDRSGWGIAGSFAPHDSKNDGIPAEEIADAIRWLHAGM